MTEFTGTKTIIQHMGERTTVAAVAQATGLRPEVIYRRYREGQRDEALARTKKTRPALTDARLLLAKIHKLSKEATASRTKEDRYIALAEIIRLTERYSVYHRSYESVRPPLAITSQPANYMLAQLLSK